MGKIKGKLRAVRLGVLENSDEIDAYLYRDFRLKSQTEEPCCRKFLVHYSVEGKDTLYNWIICLHFSSNYGIYLSLGPLVLEPVIREAPFLTGVISLLS